jgi:hypothetical protein
MIATIELNIDAKTRTQICDQMSDGMGGYIEALGKSDFADWTADEWQKFISVAFDVAATAVFMKRIVVVPPFVEEHIPF